jgi:hypothetical protein
MVALVAAAAVLRLIIAWMPDEWLLRHVLGDDPFYYFTIARNLGHGHGLTFDGVEPTNGVHPMWLVVITPIFGWVHDPWTAVHLCLTLAAVIDVVALVLFIILLRELRIGGTVIIGAAGLYGLSPLLLSGASPLNGLETALSLLATFAFLIHYRRVAEGPRTGPQFVGLSLGAAFLFLTRTDSAILLLFAFAWLLWRVRFNRSKLVGLTAAAFGAACVVAPWLIWSWRRFGSPIQVSGLAAAYVSRAMFESHGGTWLDYASKVIRNLATLFAYVPVGRGVASTLGRRATANVIACAVLSVSVFRLAGSASPLERRAFRARLTPWWPLLVGASVFVVVHTLRAIELRSWYFATLVPIYSVLLALGADFLARSLGERSLISQRRVGIATAASLMAMLASGWCSGLAGRCGELGSYAALTAANRMLPEGTRIGAWNAGLFGYFYQQGQVVNLDGLVNNSAYRHILDRSLGRYAAERRIDYLLDADGAIDFGKPYWDGGREVSFPTRSSPGEGIPGCRRMVLVPLHTEE